MLDQLSSNESKIQKYKLFYTRQTEQTPRENVPDKLAELKALQHEQQVYLTLFSQQQKDELLQSYRQQQKLQKKVTKLKLKNSELQQNINDYQQKIKQAIANRDTAIGEKFVIQKKYEELQNKQQSLSTEPSQQIILTSEARTEGNTFDSVEQLKLQMQTLEQRYVQIKTDNNQRKQELEDCQFELKKYLKVIQEQKKTIIDLQMMIESQAKQRGNQQMHQTKKLSYDFNSSAFMNGLQNQSYQSKNVNQELSRGYNQRSSQDQSSLQENPEKSGEQFSQQKLGFQLNMQKLQQEQTKKDQNQRNIPLTSRDYQVDNQQDLPDIIFSALNFNSTNQQVSKQRIEKCFGKDAIKSKKPNRWF